MKQPAILAVMLTAGLLAGPAVAQTVPSTTPEAQLVMPPASSASLNWRGRGATRDGVAFCVSSTSGRFALNVTSLGQGLTGTADVPYSIRFEVDGHQQEATLSRRNPIVRFEGTVAADRDCDRGPNARMVISLSNDQALAGDAGSYGDQVSLAVEPL